MADTYGRQLPGPSGYGLLQTLPGTTLLPAPTHAAVPRQSLPPGPSLVNAREVATTLGKPQRSQEGYNQGDPQGCAVPWLPRSVSLWGDLYAAPLWIDHPQSESIGRELREGNHIQVPASKRRFLHFLELKLNKVYLEDPFGRVRC